MIPNWTNHLKDPDEKKRFTQHMYNSKSVLDRLTAILKDMEDERNRSETDVDSYDCPSWAAKQAHNNGFRECVQKITKLITLDQRT
jgi:hypothetical protein